MMVCLALATAVMVATSTTQPVGLIIYPPPDGEPASADYVVTVDGRNVFCYTTFQFIPADARSTGDTALKASGNINGRGVSPVSFCSFDASGPVKVKVTFLKGLKDAGIDTRNVIVRPLAHNIKPAMTTDGCEFTIDEPCQLSIEPGGSLLHPLHIFANPPETGVTDPNDPNVRYFGPGLHYVDSMTLQSGQTVYLAGGSVVYLKPRDTGTLIAKPNPYGGTLYPAEPIIQADGVTNITIRGRGILCGRKAIENRQEGLFVKMSRIKGLKIEGVILREGGGWSVRVHNSRDVHIDNVKALGYWISNDGFAIDGSGDVLVENSFCHNADDSFEVKVHGASRNVTFRNCVTWNNLGGSFGLMHESYSDSCDITFADCTSIHSIDNVSACPVVGIKLGPGPGNASRYRFENIVIESVSGPRRPPIKVINNWDGWSLDDYSTSQQAPYEMEHKPTRDKPNGRVADILFKNVTVLDSSNSQVVLVSDGPQSPITNIVFDNVVINGRPLQPNDPRFVISDNVTDIRVLPKSTDARSSRQVK